PPPLSSPFPYTPPFRSRRRFGPRPRAYVRARARSGAPSPGGRRPNRRGPAGGPFGPAGDGRATPRRQPGGGGPRLETGAGRLPRSEEHTSELQSLTNLV